MKLLHCITQKVYPFTYPPPVQYGILSHTWSSPHDDEWAYYDSENQHADCGRQDIITRVCELALSHNLQYMWIDDACIDKSSSAEVSKAINSLAKYFRRATICFAFLVDLPCGASLPCKETWARCQFWTRAWTLQELILPSKIQFYDAHWHLRGERSSESLYSIISGITGIDEDILNHQRTLQQASVARKMSWAACRKSSTPEDIAYSLLGLFDVYMPVIFGEGKDRAFRRLQEEIVKHNNDSSLFAWTSDDDKYCRGLFASSPDEFLLYAQHDSCHFPFDFKGFVTLTSKGVLVSGQFASVQDDLWLDLGVQAHNKAQLNRQGVLLRQGPDGTFIRTISSDIQSLPASEKTTAMQVMVCEGEFDQNDGYGDDWSSSASADVESCATSCYAPSSPSSFRILSTPERSIGTEEPSLVDITPISSKPQIAQAEPGWVKVAELSYEGSSSDNSEDESMQMSQQTDIGWQRPESVMSNMTSVTSPASTEPDYVPSQCLLPVNRDLAEHQTPAHVPPENSDSQQSDYDDIVVHLSSVVLGHFVASQRLTNRRHKQQAKRSKVFKRQLVRGMKRRTLKVPNIKLACPYYAFDRMSHIECVANGDLSSMADVRDHLSKCHRLPYFCPTCKAEFRYSYQNDEHIIQRNCQYQNYMPYEGISEDQYRNICCTQDIKNVRIEWLKVWDIIFPGNPPPNDPYLGDRRHRDVSDLKSFWQKRGLELLRHALRERYPSNFSLGQQNFNNLPSDVLSEAIAALIEGSEQTSDIRSTTTSSTHIMQAKAEIRTTSQVCRRGDD
ncbi:Vegetative incompatibility protein HET-E-1 [Colletotrichum tropicale]|nr:Vegetative incompatibility protein HET-E-1 [Colletotrichum tropicale]